MLKETTGQIPTAGVTLIPAQALDYSRLYLDFVSGEHSLDEFYPSREPSAVASALDNVRFDRDAMADILTRQNRAFGVSDDALRNIERLRDQRSVCIFAGQQAGLFSGPMFTIIKALGIVRLARLYEERLGRPVIPIFWMAGDDHDFVEINHAYVLSRTGQVTRIEYRAAPATPVPAAETNLDDPDELERIFTELGACLGETDLTSGMFDLLKGSYTTRDTMVSAFGKLMAALTAEFGLVLFNPSDGEVKRLGRTFFRTVLDEQESIHKTLGQANEHLRQKGYHLQVEKKDDATHLFCNLDGRTPVRRDDASFAVGSHRFGRTQIDDILAEHPEQFSPDVLTRPLFQASLFPVLIQMGGPSEIAYYAQLNGLFPMFGRPAPVYVARPSITILERRIEQTMRELNISFEDTRGDIEQAINRVLAETFPADLAANFALLRENINNRFAEFTDQALGFDAGLKETAEQVRGKIDFQLNGLEGKVFAAHKKKSQQTRERIYRVASSLYPNRTPQERCLNVTGFLARYGAGFMRYLFEHMDAEQTAHQLISLTEYEA